MNTATIYAKIGIEIAQHPLTIKYNRASQVLKTQRDRASSLFSQLDKNSAACKAVKTVATDCNDAMRLKQRIIIPIN